MDAVKRESEYKLWKKAVTRTFDWVEEARRLKNPRKNSQPPQNNRKETELCMDHYLANSWVPWC